MDARIYTNELVGDTRRYYYIVRTAGSVLAPPEQEMLELAVLNGVAKDAPLPAGTMIKWVVGERPGG